VVFSFEPNFRAFTEGTQRLLWNAVFGPDPGGARGLPVGAPHRAGAERAARVAVEALPYVSSPIRVGVGASDFAEAERVIERYTDRFVVLRSGRDVVFLLANPKELSIEEHPWARLLAGDLRAASLKGVVFSLD